MASSSTELAPIRADRQPNRTASPVEGPTNDPREAYPAFWVSSDLIKGPQKGFIQIDNTIKCGLHTYGDHLINIIKLTIFIEKPM